MDPSLKKSFRLLLIDDDEDEYLFLKELVSGVKRIHLDVDWVDSVERALLTHQRQGYDVFLVDYRLGPVTGLEVIRELVSQGVKSPIILITGQGNYEIDEAAQQAGASDYLAKGDLNFSILERAIRYAMEHKNIQADLESRVKERTRALQEEVQERKLAQEASRQSEARFRALANTTSAAIFISRDMEIRYANPAAKNVTGYDPVELMEKKFWQLAHPDYQLSLKQQGLGNPWAPTLPFRFELKIVRKDGVERWLDLTSGPIEYENQPAWILTAFDITERDIAEAELRKTRDELEERVAARTLELQQVNEKLQLAVEETYRRAKELDALRNATSMLLSTIDLEELLSHIVDAAQKAIPAAQKGALYILIPKNGKPVLRPGEDLKDPRIHIEALPKIKGVPAKAIRSGKPAMDIHIYASTSAPEDRRKSSSRREDWSSIAAPLHLDDQPLGALLLTSANRGAFLESDLDLLQSFASTAAVAIRNARLHGQVHQMALTDPLTGAFNRRGFFETSERELERFHRYGNPLSMIFMDVDKFKSINDLHGHAAGDRVLKAVVDRTFENLRHMDVIGRMGGDEFAILLPDTSLTRAKKIAERIRKAVMERPVSVSRKHLDISTTIGVTTARSDIPNMKALLDRADKALYEAKHKGRNRVAVR